MKHRERIAFSLFYWGILLFGLGIYLYTDGRSRLEEYSFTDGLVIDQVEVNHPSFRGDYTTLNPQISYRAEDSDYIFVDHHAGAATGSRVSIIYLRKDAHDAAIYGLHFWLNFGIIIPTFIFGAALYSVLLIRSTDYGRQKAILPGTLDEFRRPQS